MIWSDLDEAQQADILARYAVGPEAESLADEYGLRLGSLERKMRLLKPVKRELFARNYLRLEVDEPKKVFIYGDTHFGSEDEQAINAALIVAREFAPDIVINLGDTIDGYAISKFKKDVSFSGLQEERDRWAEWAEKLNAVTPGARRLILEGNHEGRFSTFLSGNAGIADLQEMTVGDLLYLDELGYEDVVNVIYVNPSGDDLFPSADLYVLHGERALANAGSSARAASDMFVGASTITGHAHRSAIYTKRTHRGMVYCYEVGTLARLDPSYDLVPNWSQSILTGVIAPGYHSFNLNLIDRGKVFFNGQLYSV